MPSPTYAQHPGSPDMKLLSPHLSPFAHSLHQESSTSNLPPEPPPNHAEACHTDGAPQISSSVFSGRGRPSHDSSTPASKTVKPNALQALTSKSSSEGPKTAGKYFEPVTASKRTSSGQIKRLSISGVDALEKNHDENLGYPRSSRWRPDGVSVSELSQQLRTHLSYAMIKVQNGWEANTLDEIERITSPHASPRFSLPTAVLGGDEQIVGTPLTATTSSLSSRGSSSASSQGMPAPTSQQISGTISRQTPVNGPEKSALAPPANIVPGARRRPHPANTTSGGYRSVNSPRSVGTKQRTASQNAAMEADAVETLLFMASPGNSSHRPSTSGGKTPSARVSGPASAQTSPLKSGFSSKTVAFTDMSDTPPRITNPSSRFVEIERMIDEMDDTSTDSGHSI